MAAAAGALAGAAALVTLAVGAVGAAHGAGDGPGGGDRSGGAAAGALSGSVLLPAGARGDGGLLSELTHRSDGARPSGADGEPADGEGVALRAYGRFAPPGSFVPSTALTYDRTLVPAGAWIVVEQSTERSGTVVRARVGGVKAGHAFGAHVHTAPCDADPAGAGPHYQHRPAPGAEPANELWLDFTTDAAGEGNAETRHDWGLRRGGAQSVVLHAEQGGAGTRVACFTVPFGGYGAP
ncbi:superoxide dismutase family protein [Streptomyces chengbuensis]|uniref:superoxide dismutase family protein n=1 Tax=Streptomyces chengbuensis TaxID=3053466 RepID=UPI0025B38E2A|nr:superoxide dismutase family protein [Streptomyces sp. HUAS CB01]WJY50220.1 superoxide dismutase family protein [Streptomyces sp. HUAS CB01]